VWKGCIDLPQQAVCAATPQAAPPLALAAALFLGSASQRRSAPASPKQQQKNGTSFVKCQRGIMYQQKTSSESARAGAWGGLYPNAFQEMIIHCVLMHSVPTC
jgi:hypothetical protein